MPLAFLHPADTAVVVAYLALVTYLGYRGSRGFRGSDGFFLAGRGLGRVYQFFLNFGNATDANGAVSTVSLVYRQGVAGIWLGFQLIFINPYFWFMNTWFRRVRLITMADLFTDRLGSRGLASFYAAFQIIITTLVVVGFGNLVTYKICSALVVKSEAAWTVGERAAVEGHRELQLLRAAATAAPLAPAAATRLAVLREREARGDLRGYITQLRPLPFYLVYTLVLGAYVVLGGLAATALNEVLQSLIIVAFSILLLPAGFAAIGGASQLAARVPAARFDLFGSGADAGQFDGLAIAALVLTALVQINGILGNMGVAGSAKDEFAARFGAAAGIYGKRLMFILWAFTGLIALAYFRGDTALADPDLAWGLLARQLLGPGLLGLMIAGVLAANMSTISTQTVAASALFARNLWRTRQPGTSDARTLRAGRAALVGMLAAGVFAALSFDNVFTALVLVQTVNVPVGATVWMMFFWRRLTVPAAWTAILAATALNLAGPYLLAQVPALRLHPVLTTRVAGADGANTPVYFEKVARLRPEDPASPLQGGGRLHLELVLLRGTGLDPARLSAAHRFAARFFIDALTPFVFLVLVSLATRPPPRAQLDQFFGKMKTPVGATPALEALALAATRQNPRRHDDRKLLGPDSAWEFGKWDRVDTVGFLVCCAVSAGILALFVGLLRWAAAGA